MGFNLHWFSTIMLYTLYPSDPFSFEGFYDNIIYVILSLLVIPGQLFSWGMRYGGFDSWTTELLFVSLSQLMNLLIWWKIILYVKRK
jgi:hypothetical protein